MRAWPGELLTVVVVRMVKSPDEIDLSFGKES